MSRIATVLLLLLLMSTAALAQFSLIGEINGYTIKNKPGVPDSLRPWLSDQGVRRVWTGKDLDKDGKQELIVTDYSNGGKVHVFEMTSPNTLELVWSSPPRTNATSGSTPRAPRTGDLDGDGNQEIIFTLSTGTVDFEVQVWEYNGTDNSYGDPVTKTPSLTLPASYFSNLGIGAFRTNRETMDVNDYDGDGRDELIMANRDNKVYVLGVQGEFPGFGGWQVEGGDPAVAPENGFIGPSWWHSIAADIDGDGKKEIVNHYYDFYGMWSIDPTGPDTYRYPRPVAEGKTNHVFQYTKSLGYDACSYFGIHPADVDGDGKQEIAGIIYTGGSTIEFNVALVSLTKKDTGVYVWKDSTQFGIIGEKMWGLAGKTSGENWGMNAYDFDGDKKDEIYIGGGADYNIIQMKYKGTGNILDKGSYANTVVYPGDKARYHVFAIYDSLGLKRDTIATDSPFLTGMFPGGDMDGDGKKELAISYQSIKDSIPYTYYHWDTTLIIGSWKQDSVRKVLNTNVINVRVLEYQGTTGFKEETYAFVGPDDYMLDQNYPNPFNPSTTIRFSLPVDKKVSLTVYDMLGKEVKTLLGNQDLAKGSHTAIWDATNSAGNPVASGSYVYTLKYGNFSKSQKMMLVR